MQNTYWIGGSPCSGKSTLAEKFIETFECQYYKCDDHLDAYMNKGAADGSEIMKKCLTMTKDETWLRSVDELVSDEFLFYEEAFKYIIEDLKAYDTSKPIVIEGAALLPRLMRKVGIPSSNYICIVPSADFQRSKYSERLWVNAYLEDCSNATKAFENWMDRDIRFAEIVLEEAKSLGYQTLFTDGSQSIENMYDQLIQHFKPNTYMGDASFWNHKFKQRSGAPLMPEAELVSDFPEGTTPKKILELACGDGRNLLYLAKMGHEVTGIDFSEAALSRLEDFAAEETLAITTLKHDLNTAHFISTLAEYDVILINHYRLHESLYPLLEEHLAMDGILWVNGFAELPKDNPQITENDLIVSDDFKQLTLSPVTQKKYTVNGRTFVKHIYQKGECL